MTDVTAEGVTTTAAGPAIDRAAMAARVAKRRTAEWRFQAWGVTAIVFGLLCVLMLFAVIIGKGYTAFEQSSVMLDVALDPAVIDPNGTKAHDDLMAADYPALISAALYKRLGVSPDDAAATTLADGLISNGADVDVRQVVLDNPALIGTTQKIWLLTNGNVDAVLKGTIDRAVPEESRQIKDQQLIWIDRLVKAGWLKSGFNWGLFTRGASSQPETAGLGVAAIGSFFMMLTVLLVAVPLGVAAAIYQEEFAPRNRWTDLIEVNISNLAAVPSIVFGLLGLAILINFVGLPRSASLVGGLVLALMTLPTVIIAARAAITAVPPSIRQAALGVGASKMQSIFDHVLPLAMPGILTGTIIGLAKALGETAPLLMIGMVAFVVDYPKTPMDPATALPVQIYMWSSAQERGFVERTSGATMVLLLFLLAMNLIAVILRRRFERKW